MITQWILLNEAENQINFFPTGDQLREVQNFILAWGFAEKLITNQYNRRSLGVGLFSDYIDNNSRAIEVNQFVITTYNFYKQRYFSSNNAQANFDGLNFRPQEEQYKNEVLRIFANNESNQFEKIKAVAFITTRLRHNLAHGEKTLPDIIVQQDLVRAATYGICGIVIAFGLAQDYGLRI